MGTTFVNSVFQEYTDAYDSTEASSTGEVSGDSSKFSSAMMAQIAEMKAGTFLSSKFGALAALGGGLLDAIQGLIGKVKGLLDRFGPGALLSKLKGLDLLTGNLLRDLGLASLMDMLSIVSTVTAGLIDKFLKVLMSRIHIPNLVYLLSLKMFKIAKSDMNYADSYIRKLVVSRDIYEVVKWMNDEDNIKYTGLPGDNYFYEAITAARNSAPRVVNLVLESLYIHYNEMSTLVHPTGDPQEQARYDQIAFSIKSKMYKAVKTLLVYGLSNVDAGTINGILTRYKLDPVAFGTTDTEYGGAYTITDSDINMLAPFYIPLEGGVVAARDFISRGDDRYINPRNKNIKQIYLILISKKFSQRCYNVALATRLSFKIISTVMMELDKATAGSVFPEMYLEARDKIRSAAYRYTLEIEDWLYNPKKLEYIRRRDRINIDIPNEDDFSKDTASSGGGIAIYSDEKEYQYSTGISDSIVKNVIGGGVCFQWNWKTLDNYISSLVDAYMAANCGGISMYISKKILRGELTITNHMDADYYTMKSITYNITPNMETLNFDQLLPYITAYLSTLNDNTEYIYEAIDMNKILSDTIAKLKADGIYVEVANNTEAINGLTGMVTKLNSDITKLVNGEIASINADVTALKDKYTSTIDLFDAKFVDVDSILADLLARIGALSAAALSEMDLQAMINAMIDEKLDAGTYTPNEQGAITPNTSIVTEDGIIPGTGTVSSNTSESGTNSGSTAGTGTGTAGTGTSVDTSVIDGRLLALEAMISDVVINVAKNTTRIDKVIVMLDGKANLVDNSLIPNTNGSTTDNSVDGVGGSTGNTTTPGTFGTNTGVGGVVNLPTLDEINYKAAYMDTTKQLGRVSKELMAMNKIMNDLMGRADAITTQLILATESINDLIFNSTKASMTKDEISELLISLMKNSTNINMSKVINQAISDISGITDVQAIAKITMLALKESLSELDKMVSRHDLSIAELRTFARDIVNKGYVPSSDFTDFQKEIYGILSAMQDMGGNQPIVAGVSGATVDKPFRSITSANVVDSLNLRKDIDKHALDGVKTRLISMGVDVFGMDSEKYEEELDIRMHEMDQELIDFDIDNPSSMVLVDIRSRCDRETGLLRMGSMVQYWTADFRAAY